MIDAKEFGVTSGCHEVRQIVHGLRAFKSKCEKVLGLLLCMKVLTLRPYWSIWH